MARVEVFARTEVGNTRERNEDAFLVLDLAADAPGLRPEQRVIELAPPGVVLAVCDGMGGAAAGDLASRMAVEGLQSVAQQVATFTSPAQAEAALLDAVKTINQAIIGYTTRNPTSRGMGTTMTAAVLFGTTVVICHVGDSRAYLRRGRTLKQLTNDQSVVGKMVASGQLTPEQARTYDQRNVLLQALGVQPVVSPELISVDVMAGDVLLLCSDGLNGPLPDEQILDVMLRLEDPMKCCRALTEAACGLGGPDNVTVAIGRFIGEGLPLPSGPTNFRISHREATVGGK